MSDFCAWSRCFAVCKSDHKWCSCFGYCYYFFSFLTLSLNDSVTPSPSPLLMKNWLGLIRDEFSDLILCFPLQSTSTSPFCSFLASLIKTTRLVHLSEPSSERYSLPRHIRPICGGAAAGTPSAHCRVLRSDVRRRHPPLCCSYCKLRAVAPQ